MDNRGNLALYEEPVQDNLYEGTSYSYPERAASRYERAGKTNQTLKEPKVASSESKGRSRIRIAGIVVTACIFVALLLWNKADLLYINYQLSTKDGNGTANVAGGVNIPGSVYGEKLSASCLELRTQGNVNDGLYYIQPNADYSPSRVYCDMTTQGGGWTLVASIHENDIKRKCDNRDMWSEFASADNAENIGSWVNNDTFGDVLRCTSSDYKGVGYFDIAADDVMIWHVERDVSHTAMKSEASFRYRTNSQFLPRFGGNLHDLYNNHFPLTPIRGDDGSPLLHISNEILDLFENAGAFVNDTIPDWYDYSDLIGSTYLENGAMFSSRSNRLGFGTPKCRVNSAVYGKHYSCSGSTMYAETTKSSPFFAVAILYNELRNEEHIYFEVKHSRAQTDNITRITGTMNYGNYKLQYHLLRMTDFKSPSVCELHFLISNTKEWKSVEPRTYENSLSLVALPTRRHAYTANGAPANIVMGYVLLSRSAGKIVSKEQAKAFLNRMLKEISTVKTLSPEYSTFGHSEPVIFDKGSPDQMLQVVPPLLRSYVQPGYIQFRAYNLTGYPNALCPGVKVNTNSPEYVCVGGVSNDNTAKGTCGDYAGWDGIDGNTASNKESTEAAHSLPDISSVMLIFYR